jgi:hypothetical protein
VLSPKQITDVITESSGLKLVKEGTMETKEEGMKDGYWEVDYTLRKRGADLGRFIEGKVPEAESRD